MARKLKVIPLDKFDRDLWGETAHQEPLEIISPNSWELNTNTNVIQEQGVLGNIVTHTLPFQERTYSFNWVGPRKEINRIVNYFTKTSHRHFLLGNISDHNVVTPGIMFNSKGMLASVAEKYRFPGEIYRDYLTVFGGEGYNPGSIGVKVNYNSYFAHIDTGGSAEAYLFISRGVQYEMSLNPVGYAGYAADKNNLDFHATYYSLDNQSSNPTSETIRLNRNTDTHTILPEGVDRVMKLSLVIPTTITSTGIIRGVLNYIPPIIRVAGTTFDLSDYEDIPSILRPVDDYVYNIISPNVAELSMNFKEISRVSE